MARSFEVIVYSKKDVEEAEKENTLPQARIFLSLYDDAWWGNEANIAVQLLKEEIERALKEVR